MDRSAPIVFALFLSCSRLHTLPCPTEPVSSNATEFTCSSPALSEFPTGFPERARIVSVEFTNISHIGADALTGLPKLQELHLSNNRLQSLPESLFRGLPELHTLDLSGNLLQDLPPGIFGSALALKTVALRGNPLGSLRPAWFHSLQRLQFLDVADTRLEEVPPSCFEKLENLTHLDLSQNFLRQLAPQTLGGLLRLEKLDLEGNRLRSLAKTTFHSTPGLKFLFLKNNSLTDLPAGLFETLDFLEFLDISSNRLASLDPQFSNKTTNVSLDLSGNPWACDCHLLPLVAWMKGPSITLYSKGEALCAIPGNLQGRPLLALDAGESVPSCAGE